MTAMTVADRARALALAALMVLSVVGAGVAFAGGAAGAQSSGPVVIDDGTSYDTISAAISNAQADTV